MLTFYVVNAVWQNIKKGGEDSTFQQNIKPVVIKSLIALSLLSLGLMVPRLISTITFEPAATITLEYDARNTNVKKFLDAILATDFFKVKKTRTKAEDEFYKSLNESQKVANDIKKNGAGHYKTLDQVLAEL